MRASWVNDRMDGWGCMHNRNGDRLEGAFVNDKLQAPRDVYNTYYIVIYLLYCHIILYETGNGDRLEGAFVDDKLQARAH